MGSVPVLGVVGDSGSGKTTLIEKLLPRLRARGLRVGVIKHDAHDCALDREGKDSWRFARAGAEVTAVTSGVQTMVVENRPASPEELAGRLKGVDLILAEGFRAASWPKLLVCGAEAALPERCAAVITDGPGVPGLPRFRRDDPEAVAAFILDGAWRDV